MLHTGEYVPTVTYKYVFEKRSENTLSLIRHLKEVALKQHALKKEEILLSIATSFSSRTIKCDATLALKAIITAQVMALDISDAVRTNLVEDNINILTPISVA